MESNIEQGTRSKEKASVLENQKIQEFIRDRNIAPEDFHFIELLAAFPKDIFITCLHNMFNMNRDRSDKELERCIEISRNPNEQVLYKTMLDFYRKHDWQTSYHLVRVLEKI